MRTATWPGAPSSGEGAACAGAPKWERVERAREQPNHRVQRRDLEFSHGFQISVRGAAVDGYVGLGSHCTSGLAGAKPCHESFGTPKRTRWQFPQNQVATIRVPNIPSYSGLSTNPKEAMRTPLVRPEAVSQGCRRCLFLMRSSLVLPGWFLRWSV